ncbi:MAG: glycosyltransferase family 4 protein [Anaerolineae bacterium]|nr:glycosyltransferase family 4 protein [Anaerolineae bacterium]
MHILIIHQAFASLDESGGTRHYEFASRLVQHGHKVTIIASPVSYITGKVGGKNRLRPARQSPLPGLTILRTYTYAKLHKNFFARVLSFLSFMVSSFIAAMTLKDIDLVWGTSPPIFQGVTAWLVARIRRAPFIFEVRDLWPEFAVAVGVLKNPILIKASEWLEEFLYHRADRVIVNSPGYIEHVSRRGAKWVEFIPNGADPDMFAREVSGSNFRQQRRLMDKFIILYAGAHGLSNDLDVVLDACHLITRHKNILVMMVGDGKEKPRLEKRANEMGLENIRFFPPVAKNEMATVLAATDACIAILKPITMYQTTYPNKVFDYMAAGKPIILAIDGVIRKVVEDSGCGIFVQPGSAEALANAMVDLANDPHKVMQMGNNGRQSIQTSYNRNIIGEHLLNFFLEVGRNNG